MAIWFITGASRGLGAAIARYVLEQGDSVVATARHPEAIARALGNSSRLLAVELDVTDESQVKRAVTTAVERFGRIDVVVNNAGRGLLGAAEEISDAEAHSVFDLNFFGTLNVIRAVLPTLRTQRSGRILNISSKSGLVGNAGGTLYNATKFAIEGLSEGLNKELAGFGIDVMVVEPGVFRTDFLDARTSLSLPAHPIAAYDGTPAHATVQWASDNNRAQFGDPTKLAALMYEVIKQGSLPVHLPIGRDTVTELEDKLAQIPRELAPWREKSLATAYADTPTSA